MDILFWTVMSIPTMIGLFHGVAWIHFKHHSAPVHFILKNVFGVLNFMHNAWTMTIIGLEPPKEMTTTARLKKWKDLNPNESFLNKWRWWVGHTVCENLNKSDPEHC